MATNRLTYTIPSLIAATAGLGVALLILGPVGQEPPPPAPAPTPAIVHTLQEDDPGFDCNTMGNRVCGDPHGTYAAEAWRGWDATPDAWRKLYVDTSRPLRMEYVGYAAQKPGRAVGMVAVPMGPTASHPYFVFRARFTDGK